MEFNKKKRRVIEVHCDNCGWIDEDNTEFINISEDFLGFDVLTFRCYKCGQKSNSLRRG